MSANRIIIIGGLDGVESVDLLGRLRDRAPFIAWQWIKACPPAFRPEVREFRKLLHQAREWHARVKKGEITEEEFHIVKLAQLHGQPQAELFRAFPDPVLVPKQVDDADALVAWIFSTEANLVPRTEWYVNTDEFALVCLLCKLLQNKSWNKDAHGHAWTQEADLLGQSPVARPSMPGIRSRAEQLLGQFQGNLFLTKGGKQGATKKEWCINSKFLPDVKQALLSRNLAKLDRRELQPHIGKAISNPDRPLLLDGEIVKERIRAMCEARR